MRLPIRLFYGEKEFTIEPDEGLLYNDLFGLVKKLDAANNLPNVYCSGCSSLGTDICNVCTLNTRHDNNEDKNIDEIQRPVILDDFHSQLWEFAVGRIKKGEMKIGKGSGKIRVDIWKDLLVDISRGRNYQRCANPNCPNGGEVTLKQALMYVQNKCETRRLHQFGPYCSKHCLAVCLHQIRS